MQTTIIHSCGHREVVQLYGSGAERERREKWLDSKPCRECERAAETTIAQTQAQAAGLPNLTGTEKQIAWAERIRAEIAGKVETLLAQAEQKDAENAPKARAAMAKALASHTDASWWIDHRGEGMRVLNADYTAALRELEVQA